MHPCSSDTIIICKCRSWSGEGVHHRNGTFVRSAEYFFISLRRPYSHDSTVYLLYTCREVNKSSRTVPVHLPFMSRWGNTRNCCAYCCTTISCATGHNRVGMHSDKDKWLNVHGPIFEFTVEQWESNGMHATLHCDLWGYWGGGSPIGGIQRQLRTCYGRTVVDMYDLRCGQNRNSNDPYSKECWVQCNVQWKLSFEIITISYITALYDANNRCINRSAYACHRF